MIPNDLLLNAVKQKGLLNDAAISEILAESQVSGRSGEDIILNKKLVDENVITQIKGEILKLPVKIFEKNEIVPLEVMNTIAEESARHNGMLAFNKENNILSVAMVHPEDPKAQESLKFILNHEKLGAKIYLGMYSDMKNYWRNYQNLPEQLNKIIQEFQTKFPRKTKTSSNAYQIVDLEVSGGAMAEEAPVIKLLSTVLNYAVRSRASDIHIEPQRTKLRVRMRVDGALFSTIFLPLELHAPLVSRIKILTNLKIDEMRVPQDGRFRTMVDDTEIDYRVSTFPTTFGEKVTIRVLDPSTGLKNIEDLGLMGRNLEVLQEGIKKPFGIILISGPTGSGKSTTLYAIMKNLNKDNVNVISLEDPVEYTMEGANQSQVLPEIGYSFARGLRQILRQDPDIILIGEIRDGETAELAIHAALTGHIVLSTIHTNNAIGVVPRLIDMGVQPFLLPSAMNLMIAQRLVRRLCPYCKKTIEATPEQTALIDESINPLSEKEKKRYNWKKPYMIYKAVGCPECKNKGFSGRIAMFEIFKMTPQLEQIILSGLSTVKTDEEAKRQEMISLRQDGIIKVLQGSTTLEEVVRES